MQLHNMIPLTDEQIRKLSVDERLALIEALWDSLEAEDIPISDEIKAELDRRLTEHEADPGGAIPWDDVRRRLMGGGA